MGYKNDVYCRNITIKDIKECFQRSDLITNNLLDSVELTLLIGDEWIPADILGSKKTEKLVVQYDDDRQDPFGLLKADANAFQSNRKYTKSLKLRNFNSSQLDL